MENYIRPYKDSAKMRDLICGWISYAKTLIEEEPKSQTELSRTASVYMTYVKCIADCLDISHDEAKMIIVTTSREDIKAQNIMALQE